jgi:hypothetical protein
MAGFLVDGGEQYILDLIFTGDVSPPPPTLEIGLYASCSVSPLGDTAVIGDLTETAGTGYARQNLTRGSSWTQTSDYVQYTNITFNAGGTWTAATGYFICVPNSPDILLFIEEFASPYLLLIDDQLTVVPKITAA